MTGASESEAREFAKAFRSFLEWVHSEQAGAWERNEVAALVGDFLGGAGLERSVVSRSLAAFEHVNLQTALDAWSREPGREVEVQGISTPPHYGPVTLQQLVTGEGMPPLRLSAPALVDLPGACSASAKIARLRPPAADPARCPHRAAEAGSAPHHDVCSGRPSRTACQRVWRRGS